MGNFKKVIKLLKKDTKLDEELKTKIMKPNKIYKYSIELLLTTIFSKNLEKELSEKKDKFSSNVYDNQNLRVLLEILEDNDKNIQNILMEAVGLKKKEEEEETVTGFGSLNSNNSNNSTSTSGRKRKRKSTKTRGRKKKETTKKSSSNTSNSNRNRHLFNPVVAFPSDESPTSLGTKKKRKRKRKSSRTRRNAKKNM
jgi:hypothetical protein